MMDTVTIRSLNTIEGLEIMGELHDGFDTILTPEALAFIKSLQEHFNDRRKDLLQFRKERQKEIDQGIMPDFLEDTKDVRKRDWQVAPLPPDLMDRRVEITGPVDRKMIINALNSGAKVFMADFEDSNSPTWFNTIQGQINLRDAVNRDIEYTHPVKGKHYKLNKEIATLMVRPRGLHLEEKHLLCKGEKMSASLVDFGLYFFHNADNLISKGTGPYFYLPKLESHFEARLWNDIFIFSQEYMGIPNGTIKATVLIETILASFEMDEILHELREHSAGLNCGRWDYIFSYIKKFRNLKGYVVPDRAQVGMKTPFMSAYSHLVIKTCHRRGVHAMGGMAAFIPIKNDPEANIKAIDKVQMDKLLEVQNGHDGTWVAHPGLVKVAMDIFDEYMPEKNQIINKRTDVVVKAEDLLEIPKGTITEEGLRTNINVGILYIESWLRGVGAAALYHLMEDAATAEISRTQVWQWIHNGARMVDGRVVTYELYRELLEEELIKIREYVGDDLFENGRFKEAVTLFDKLVKDTDYVEFLTLPAYELIE